jgi:hypothetical protein
MHIADLSIHANHDDIFRVEVAFSQTLAKVQQKIGHMLQDESLLGVLLVRIEETPKMDKSHQKVSNRRLGVQEGLVRILGTSEPDFQWCQT